MVRHHTSEVAKAICDARAEQPAVRDEMAETGEIALDKLAPNELQTWRSHSNLSPVRSTAAVAVANDLQPHCSSSPNS